MSFWRNTNSSGNQMHFSTKLTGKRELPSTCAWRFLKQTDFLRREISRRVFKRTRNVFEGLGWALFFFSFYLPHFGRFCELTNWCLLHLEAKSFWNCLIELGVFPRLYSNVKGEDFECVWENPKSFSFNQASSLLFQKMLLFSITYSNSWPFHLYVMTNHLFDV